MSYQGYMFQFGSYKFSRMIRADTYKITPNARQDLDSYRDANGELHRTALDHTATSVTFTIPAHKEREHEEMMSAIRSSYINEKERDAQCSYYDPETCTYKTGHFYIDSNWTFQVYGTYDGQITFQEYEVSFVEY